MFQPKSLFLYSPFLKILIHFSLFHVYIVTFLYSFWISGSFSYLYYFLTKRTQDTCIFIPNTVITHFSHFSSVQLLSRVWLLCDPMNHSTPSLPVYHQLPEFTQTHVHRVSDAIQLSHPLSSPSPPAPNPSQHPGLFQWVNSSHEVAKVLEFQL